MVQMDGDLASYHLSASLSELWTAARERRAMVWCSEAVPIPRHNEDISSFSGKMKAGLAGCCYNSHLEGLLHHLNESE